MSVAQPIQSGTRRLGDCKAVGRVLGCSWRTVIRLADAGKIPPGYKLSAPQALGHGRNRSLHRQRMQTAEGSNEGGPSMSTPEQRPQGGTRGRGAPQGRGSLPARSPARSLHPASPPSPALATARSRDRDGRRRGRADRAGTEGIDARLLGTVPGPLARARIIRRAGFVAIVAPEPARINLVQSGNSPIEPGQSPGSPAILTFPTPSQATTPGRRARRTSKPPSPAPLAVALHQPSLF